VLSLNDDAGAEEAAATVDQWLFSRSMDQWIVSRSMDQWIFSQSMMK
jgi:hypothetical protein